MLVMTAYERIKLSLAKRTWKDKWLRLHSRDADLVGVHGASCQRTVGCEAAVRSASQKWDYALDDVRNSLPAESLLDTMDQTVERLLYHPGTESKVTLVSAPIKSS